LSSIKSTADVILLPRPPTSNSHQPVKQIDRNWKYHFSGKSYPA
jgi:hypothetical protein